MCKKIKLFCILTLTVLLSLTLSNVSKANASTVLGVSGVKQAKSQWCWAASDQMVGSFYHSSTRTQYDIVNYILGYPIFTYPNLPASLGQTATGATFETTVNKAYYYSTSSFTFSQIVNQIVNNHQPIIAAVGYYDSYGNRNGGHVVVISGCDSSGGNTKIAYIDPTTGSLSWTDYYSFCNGVINGGKYDQNCWTY